MKEIVLNRNVTFLVENYTKNWGKGTPQRISHSETLWHVSNFDIIEG